VYAAFEDGDRSLRLLSGVLSEAKFNTDRMAVAAEANFLPVTELADTLVRSTGITFRAAHHLVSNAVKELIAANIGFDPDAMTAIVERELLAVAGTQLSISRDEIRQSLSARNFVDIRRIPGGPSACVLEPEILRAREQVAKDRSWLDATSAYREKAHLSLHQQCDDLLRSENVARQGV
jgi:argininosuccinate lyase